MSALAVFMSDRGHIVVGSDRAFDRNPSHPVYRFLKSKGIAIVPQDGHGIDESFDLAVFSTAVEEDRPEVVRAKALGVPIKTRPAYLAEVVRQFQTIAVAGTSGKSTTAGMLAFLMGRLGLGPNFIGGGRVKQFRSGSNPGNSLTGDSDILVIEACESDGSIINYQPRSSVILNLDLDHHAIEETAEMFKTLLENTSGLAVRNGDDRNLERLQIRDAVTFSIETPSRYRPDSVRYYPFTTDFTLQETRFRLSLPGRHNLSNALACIALLSEMGIPVKAVAGILQEFKGVERRFDIHLNDGERLVIDDYAHNPHKISCLMETVRPLRERICYIFQPHGYGPTRMMKKEYIEVFSNNLSTADHLMLLPIFYEGGSATKDISSDDLAEGVCLAGKSAEAISGREDVLKRVDVWDTYIIFGARDETLSEFADEIARLLTLRGLASANPP